MERAHVVVVGGGIVGLATARAILQATPSRHVVVVEKEGAVGAHQSGRNSGVIHAGVYYQPGSYKAQLCHAGRVDGRVLAEHDIPHAVCGKVVVALDERDRIQLAELERRCELNGVRTEMLRREQLRELEPHVAGVGALHVLDTGIVDYGRVCESLATEIRAMGTTVRLECTVDSGRETAAGLVVETTSGPIEAQQRVVTCAGLHADEVAQAISGPAGSDGMRVIAFRGEYRSVVPSHAHLVRGLVYPVPDPQFPFLGVHLTRGIDGHVHVGPNAVLAFAREGYTWRSLDARHLRETFGFKGFRHFARQNWRFGVDEMARSVSRRRFTTAVRRLLPEIERADLAPSPAGVRAQAIRANGELVDDFAIHTTGRAVHVLNAPSPAATASLEIGKVIAARLED